MSETQHRPELPAWLVLIAVMALLAMLAVHVAIGGAR